MSMSVYNIVWADDQIDELLDKDTLNDLSDQGFNILGIAHNGDELATILEHRDQIDAVIIDANFNESDQPITSERDVSGLDYARGLYVHTLKRSIPFFLFTGRSDELLKEIYQHNPKFLEDFPRHKRWFSKTVFGEYEEMLKSISVEVSERNTTSFIVRNRYRDELAAAGLFDKSYKFIFEFLQRGLENTLTEMVEPFVAVRRSIEQIFAKCEKFKIIPPISDNTNGTVAYFVHGNYSIKKESKYEKVYEMLDTTIMPKPVACGLSYIVDITQDALHSKDKLKLKVDEYFERTKDTLLLRSVVYMMIDVLKWFALTALNNRVPEVNELTLWRKIDNE